MTELERVKSDQKLFKAFEGLDRSTKNTLEMAYNTINAIDRKETGHEDEI